VHHTSLYFTLLLWQYILTALALCKMVQGTEYCMVVYANNYATANIQAWKTA